MQKRNANNRKYFTVYILNFYSNIVPPTVPPKRSLNGDQRRKELVKITVENQAILKRLQKKSATYSVERWDK